MCVADMGLDELYRYSPDLGPPDDVWRFWESTLGEYAGSTPKAELDPIQRWAQALDSYDVVFQGFADDPIRAWLHLPTSRDGPLPCVVQYIGYGGGRGLVHQHILWAVAGYAQLVVDNRGQGSMWATGDTADPHGTGPSVPGFLTQGIDNPLNFYYRRLTVDAVRALDFVRAHPAIDSQRIFVSGVSQGGGLALLTAALRPESVCAALVDVPFLCDYRRAVALGESNPYLEIRTYLRVHRQREEQVFKTLSHFDAAALAPNARSTALFSVALRDTICPAPTVFAAYNRYGGKKEIGVYPYNDHEGGEAYHQSRQLAWVADVVREAGSP